MISLVVGYCLETTELLATGRQPRAICNSCQLRAAPFRFAGSREQVAPADRTRQESDSTPNSTYVSWIWTVSVTTTAQAALKSAMLEIQHKSEAREVH